MAAVRATRDCTSCVCLRLRNRCQVLLYAARSTTCDAHYFRAFFPLLIRFACHSRRCEPAGAFCADGCSPCVGLSRTARVSSPPLPPSPSTSAGSTRSVRPPCRRNEARRGRVTRRRVTAMKERRMRVRCNWAWLRRRRVFSLDYISNFAQINFQPTEI